MNYRHQQTLVFLLVQGILPDYDLSAALSDKIDTINSGDNSRPTAPASVLSKVTEDVMFAKILYC